MKRDRSALYYSNGKLKCETWYEENRLHRLDGPAYIYYDQDGTECFRRYMFIGISYPEVSNDEEWKEFVKLLTVESVMSL